MADSCLKKITDAYLLHKSCFSTLKKKLASVGNEMKFAKNMNIVKTMFEKKKLNLLKKYQL